MKKIILILMPFCIVLAFYGFYLNKDLNFRVMLQGFSTLNFSQLEYTYLNEALKNLEFTQYFEEAEEWYEYIPALFNMLYGFFTGLINLNMFAIKLLQFFFGNIFSFVQYLFNYLFN